MRNLLLILLLANVLYFMWERFIAAPGDNGVAIVSQGDLGPRLELAEINSMNADNSSGPNVAAVSRRTELAAQAGRSCVTVGPFRDTEDANSAMADFENDGLRGSIRTTQGEVFVGHWVQIRNIGDRATANSMLAELKKDGLSEAYVVQTEDEGIKISLGLFSEINRAERVELQAKSLDFPAEISPRMREQTVVYVDLGLPPGRGAGSMIERFGEERVLLRDAATCPRN